MTEGEQITGQSLAARAARLGQQHGRTTPRTKDRTEPTPHPRHTQDRLPATIPPRARTTDPVTSHVAADAIAGVTDVQARIIQLLTNLGPMTDDELGVQYRHRVPLGWPETSPSGLRTRRRELVDAGLVHDTKTTRPTAGGNPATVWGI